MHKPISRNNGNTAILLIVNSFKMLNTMISVLGGKHLRLKISEFDKIEDIVEMFLGV